MESPSRYSRYDEAQRLISQKKWADAVIALRSVRESAPQNLSVLFDLVRALTYSGRREEALGLLLRQAELKKGRTRDRLIRRAKVLSRAFISNAQYQDYQNGLNSLVAKKYRDARERFEKVLQKESANVEVLTRIGQCLVMEGDHDSAAERLRLARKLNPYEAEVALWLGRSLHKRGEIPEAIDLLKQASKELKSSELAPVWLSEALASSGQRKQALALLEKDLSSHPYHLRSLVTAARLRLAVLPRDPAKDLDEIWAARRHLQLLFSRMDHYNGKGIRGFESDLGVDLRNPEELKSEAQSLMQKIDGKTQSSGSNPT